MKPVPVVFQWMTSCKRETIRQAERVGGQVAGRSAHFAPASLGGRNSEGEEGEAL